MTKENFTSINVIIDQSGSMRGLASDTIGNFNKFLSDQKAETGEAVFTLCTFNTDYRLVHDCMTLADVPDLNEKVYDPNGGTALLDAMGATIESVGNKLSAMQEHDRPSKVIFLIITDGEENSSHRFTKAQIKSMVTHQSEKYQWEFVFMGANIDAISGGTSLGVSASNSINYAASAVGTKGLYESVSSNMRSYRKSASSRADFFDLNKTVTPVVPTTTTTTTVVTTSTPDKTKGNP